VRSRQELAKEEEGGDGEERAKRKKERKICCSDGGQIAVCKEEIGDGRRQTKGT